MFKFIALLLFSSAAIAQISPAELLSKIDKFRSPYTYAQLDIKIEDYKKDKLKKIRHYTVYHQDGQSLVSVLDGADKGNRILLSNKGMFVAPKHSSRAVRITPIQRLLGQASYGDLAGLSFSKNYTASMLKQTDKTITLALIANKSSATYHKIILLISQDDYRPISAEAYLTSGKLYKKMHYSIANKLLKNITYTSSNQYKKTVMHFMSIQKKKLAKRFLTSKGMRHTIR